MIELFLLQIFGILAIGDSLNSYIFRICNISSSSIITRVIASIVLGYSSFIIPMTIIGVLFVGYLQIFVYIHYAISLLLLLRKFIKFLLSIKEINFKFGMFTFTEKIFLFLIVGISLIYLFFVLIYSERGWDALNYYFPNALYFYLENGIPSGYNPFSLYPTFKPPFNVLYITYSFFVTNGTQQHTSANLHPWLLMIGTLLIVIEFSRKLSKSRSTALFTGIIFLISPLMYFMIYEFVYYQDIPVMFFMTSAFYFNSINDNKIYENNKRELNSTILSSLSAALAILSKLSGYSILLLIFLSFSFKIKNKLEKLSKVIIIVILTGFLSYNSAFDSYIGYSIVILLIGLFVMYLILKEPFIIKEKTISLGFFIFPLLIGIFWIWFMNKVSVISNFLLETYVTVENSSLSLVPVSTQNPYGVFIENGMQVSFTASILYIFTGSLLGLFWILPKIIGMFKFSKLDSIDRSLFNGLRIYFFTFMMIYMAYFGSISARYLTPILPILSIFIGIGLNDIFHFLKIAENRTLSKILIAATGTIFYYPFIPFENILLDANTRFFFYHKDQFRLILYAIVFSLIFLGLLKIKITLSKKTYRKMTALFVVIFVLLFASPQVYMLAQNDYNYSEFNNEANYAQRVNFQELIKSINNKNIDIDNLILTSNTPGLGYYVTRSVLDLTLISLSDEFLIIKNYNETEAFNFMKEHKIRLIVKLNEDHVDYANFEEYHNKFSIMKIVVQGDSFELIYENDEFILFEMIY